MEEAPRRHWPEYLIEGAGLGVFMLSAALFAFITSFDEVIVALFVATGPASTLTRRMFLALRDAIEPTIAAISTLLVALSVGLLLLVQLLGGRRAGEP